MAAAITPMANIGGGTVDVSRPNDSGIHSLAQSLDVAVRSVAEIGQQAQINEFQHVKSLLNDATVGPDEAKEIAGNAFFPLNRFAAQNRAGEAMVHEARDAIAADLESATDSLDARQRLRAHQQKLMESAPELGVQAGIRQAMSDLAEPLINQASKRRLENRNIQRRNDESFILRDTFLNDPTQFLPALKAILSDQQMDATQEPDVHKTAGQTLLNMLIENPASAPFVKQAAKDALGSGAVEGAENRAQYTGVLRAVTTLENAANNETSQNKLKKQLQHELGVQILNYVNAGAKPPPKLEQKYIEAADDPVTAQGKLKTLKEAGRQAPIGMIDTDPYRAGVASLNSFMRKSIFSPPTEEDNQIRAAAFEIYDGVMGAMDPNAVQKDGSGYTQAQQAAELAYRKASEFVASQKSEVEANKKLKENLELQQEQALKNNDDDELLRLDEQINNIGKASAVVRRRNLIRTYIDEAEQMGISVIDMRP